MYKNHGKYTSTLVWSILGLVFGILPALCWGLLLLACFVTGEMETSVIVFSTIFMIMGIVFTVLGIRGLLIISAVSNSNWIFEKDPDGIVGMDTLLNKKHKKKGCAYERRLLRAVEKGYFVRLTYDRTNRIFEMSDRVNTMNEYNTRYIGKNCPNCGAPLKIKKGTSITCDRCGQEVEA